MAKALDKRKTRPSEVDDWLDEDGLELLECWSRDGYTFQDIATRIGVDYRTLVRWRQDYPEINTALKRGREIIDYKVENALLKSALGYKTKEVKVTTVMRYGKVIETTKEVSEKDQAPNVTACQVWLYNRLPDKWRKNRDHLIELDEEDSSIQITVKRANTSGVKQQPTNPKDEEIDEEWQDEVNNSVEVSRKHDTDSVVEQKAKPSKSKSKPKVSQDPLEQDLDYWPDDWES